MENPYDILGVPQGASLDEVKKAYRKKARENHPDLNPNDPKAEERMNKINEAYDRIVNPEKYAASDARKRASNAGAGYNPYSGYGGAGGTSQGTGGQSTQGGPQYTYGPGPHSQGPYGWTTINFEDLFGGGWGTPGAASGPIHPEANASDSAEVRQAINAINSKNWVQAINILQQIPSTGRTARWYYLFALANNGAGNQIAAHDNIRRARQLDPDNMDYIRAEANFNQRAQTYTQQGQGQGFTVGGFDPAMCCCCLCLAPTCCTPLMRMFMYSSYWH